MEEKAEIADNSDVWDDTLLIKAYDKSVKLAREELAKRIAKSTNKNSTPEVRESRSADSESDNGSAGAENLQVNGKSQNFKVGDYARATYDDGIDYEAKIVYINHSTETCLLKYIGYGNQQEVRLSDLLPSWGKSVRRLQFSKAKESNTSNAAFESSEKKKNKNHFGFNTYNVVPPPPPMPPMPHVLGLNQNFENSDHLSAMLMSWYLSGYYTGIYQGAEMAKSNTRRKKQ